MWAKNITSLVLLVLTSSFVCAQATFTAFTDAQQIFQDGYVEVTFTLKNADGSAFSPPAFNDFSVVAGPSRSIQTTVINGQLSKEMSYTYSVQPRRTGTLIIGPANIKVGGVVMQTKPIEVDVLQRDAIQQGARDYYVEVVPSSINAYVGQQIRLDYRLYTTIEIQNYNIVEEPDYAGFYAEDLRRTDTRLRREIINGNQYFTRTLKSIALYPQQAGQITIPSALLQLGIVSGDRDNYSIFFGNSVKRVPFRTDSVVVNVMPLPRPVPEGFAGAVGDFRLRTSTNRTTLTTDDAISVTMEISGNGDLKRIQAPDPDLPESFDVYDPETEEYNLGEVNGFKQGQKVFTFLAQPKEAGLFTISPRFVYFDSDSIVYRTLGSDTLSLTIRQGVITANAPDVVDELLNGPQNVGALRLDTRLRYGTSLLLVTEGWFWSITGLPLVLFLGLLVYRRKQKAEERLDPKERRQREAQKMAQGRLQQARQYQQAANSSAFYDEISKAMLNYVGDKLQMERATLSKDNVQIQLSILSVDPQKTTQFVQMLKTCETALYAGMDKSAAMEVVYHQAIEMLAIMEQQIQAQEN